MSKAILILDEMNEDCGKCKLGIVFSNNFYCGGTGYKELRLQDLPKPEWCPLKELSKYMADTDAKAWINASKKVPKDQYPVLVYDQWGDYSIACYENGEWRSGTTWIVENDIVFWRPLPEAPEDEICGTED